MCGMTLLGCYTKKIHVMQKIVDKFSSYALWFKHALYSIQGLRTNKPTQYKTVLYCIYMLYIRLAFVLG
jgi:hypothetical protein